MLVADACFPKCIVGTVFVDMFWPFGCFFLCAFCALKANEHSSRSHCLLLIYIDGLEMQKNIKMSGKLVMVDLAGSERISKTDASGARLKEAQHINKSLAALGNVINALKQKQNHIPFRDSKLTYLLQDSLSKDNKALMITQISPTENDVSETMCTLQFATRVRGVELGAGKLFDHGIACLALLWLL